MNPFEHGISLSDHPLYFDQLPRDAQLIYAEHSARQYLAHWRSEAYAGKRHKDEGVSLVATFMRARAASLYELSAEQLGFILLELDRGEKYRGRHAWTLSLGLLIALTGSLAVPWLARLPGISVPALVVIGAFIAIALAMALLELRQHRQLAMEARYEEHWYRQTLIRRLGLVGLAEGEVSEPGRHGGA